MTNMAKGKLIRTVRAEEREGSPARSSSYRLVSIRLRRIVAIVLLVAVSAPFFAGCFGGEEKLTVLAGSEVRDLEPLLDRIARDTGIRLEFEYTGTLDGAEQLMSGKEVDLAWFSHAKYITLLAEVNNRVRAQEKIMLSPVVLGVKESKAREWGWIDNADVTWRDIAEKSSSGELQFAMTNPASSNSGFTALVGVASALADTGDALRLEDIDTESLRRFFAGQALTAGSSGWLADAYVREQDRLDGLINYESVLLQLNEGNQLQEQLYLVYPKEGIITADYPLLLINPDKREQYQKLVDYLREPEMQRAIMEQTFRRPVNPQVPVSDRFPKQVLLELPFPNDVQVLDQLVYGYLDQQRRPAHTVYVLDKSGSMDGDRIRDLRAALLGLTGLDTSLTGQFSRFRSREIITMLPFSSAVEEATSFVIDDPAGQSSDMGAIRTYVDNLEAGGGTAIYAALLQAYAAVAEAYPGDPQRYYSIVLMSDGENNDGDSYDDFVRLHRSFPPELQNVPVFTVLFGDGNRDEMSGVAELTGGRLFDARTEALSTIFKEIRGYQ
jgi:Ca-activated chloride channel homolog